MQDQLPLKEAVAHAIEEDAEEVEELAVDPKHSSVSFSVRHMVLSTIRGSFTRFSGTVLYLRSDVPRSSINMAIDARSVCTGDSGRDARLRSSGFLDAAAFPQITFRSMEVRELCRGCVCAGDLTIRGVTRRVEIPFEITGRQTDLQGKDRLGFAGQAQLDRNDFGIGYDKRLPNGGPIYGSEITIDLSLEAVSS